MGIKTKWDYETILEVALQCDSISEFRGRFKTASDWADKLGIFKEVSRHMTKKYKYLSTEEIHNIALRYEHRGSFRKQDFNTYAQARRRGILDSVCSHMTRDQKWDKEAVKTEALKYSHRGDFYSGCKPAYQSAINLNILDDVCSHMVKKKSYTDNDCIYIWNIKNTKHYKIGITSFALGIARIESVSKESGLDYDIVLLCKTNNARKVEKQLLSLGENAGYIGFNGSSEIRFLKECELEEAKNIILKETKK